MVDSTNKDVIVTPYEAKYEVVDKAIQDKLANFSPTR